MKNNHRNWKQLSIRATWNKQMKMENENGIENGMARRVIIGMMEAGG
jgi:hypothetical protein